MTEFEFLQRQWHAVSPSPLPVQVIEQFQVQIIPLLKISSINDPYIIDAVDKIINGYFLSSAVQILQKNARAGEQIAQSVDKILNTKTIVKSSTLIGSTVAIVSLLVFCSFTVGSIFGAYGSEWWVKREETQKIFEYDEKMNRLKFLRSVNYDLMHCTRGKIYIDKKTKKKMCYMEEGWPIE